MKQDDIADAILHELYLRRGDDSGVPSFAPLIASRGITDHAAIGRAAKILRDLGLITNYFAVSGPEYGGLISGRAVSIIERIGLGASVMDHLNSSHHQSGGVHFHGSVTQSNIAFDSTGVRQSIVVGADAKELLALLIEAIGKDETLSDSQRSEALGDADTIKTEIEKAKPNWKVVSGLLTALGSIASAAAFVTKLKADFGL